MKSIVKYPLLLIFVFLFFGQNLFAQEISNVSFELDGEQIYIHYNLIAPANEKYEITTSLKRLNDGSFNYIPDRLSGDIGEEKKSGSNKTIVWNVSEEEFAMFDGDDFYFEVFAEKMKASGGIPWYYYLGTAAVGGVAAAVLLGGSDEPSNNPTTNSFPDPPGRP